MDSFSPRLPLPPRAFSGAGLFFFARKVRAENRMRRARRALRFRIIRAMRFRSLDLRKRGEARGISSVAVSECKFRRRISARIAFYIYPIGWRALFPMEICPFYGKKFCLSKLLRSIWADIFVSECAISCRLQRFQNLPKTHKQTSQLPWRMRCIFSAGR